MKLRIEIIADVPRAVADTMQRTGFTLAPDGRGVQIRLPNAASIPSRKVKVKFEEQSKEQVAPE